MEQYKIILPDGQVLFAGAQEKCAISHVQLTACVNPEEELMPGGVCSTMLEATVLDPTGALKIAAGDTLTLYREGEQSIKLGLFLAEKPERTGTGTYRITAYDHVSKLDRDLGQWLYDLPGWPYALQSFAAMVCRQCGVTLVNELPINGDLPISAFSGAGITGRQLMQWVCQLGGCFCRANGDGKLEFAWFTPRDICLKPTGAQFYYRGGLSGGEYETYPIEKVQLHLTDSDIGAVYPDKEGSCNTLRITGNYLLSGASADTMEQAAKALYDRFVGISYTPCTVQTGTGCAVAAGDIFTLEDRSGKVLTVYAMTTQERSGMVTVSCTGSARRDSSSALNTARYQGLNGNVLQLRADVDGMKIENANAQKELAALYLNLDGITAQVRQNQTDAQNLKTVCTTLEQTGSQLALTVQTLQTEGVQRVKTSTGYTFDEDGLHISKQGQEMENLLDNTGMYVRRSGQLVLQANNEGVTAADVTVKNYLVIGDHARLEDYADGTDLRRTACFYLA